MRARASIRRAVLQWNFASDEAAACLSLRLAGEKGCAPAPPVPLVRVEISRRSGGDGDTGGGVGGDGDAGGGVASAPPRPPAPRVSVHRAALAALDRRHVRSGLDAEALVQRRGRAAGA